MCISPIKNNHTLLNNSSIQPKEKSQEKQVDNKPIVQPEINTKENLQLNTNNTKVSGEIKSPQNENIIKAFSEGLKQKNNVIAPKGANEYSESETKSIIKAAEKHGNDLFPKNKLAASDAAWAWSLQKRNEDPKDVNWAAAEHYLYAKSRGKESKIEAITIGVLAAGYDVVKAGLFAINKEEWLSTNNRKDDISKPTVGSTISGIRGAIDSFSDD